MTAAQKTRPAPSTPSSQDHPDLIDIELFAGAGGLAVGLKNAGFFPARFFELDTNSCDTLNYNIQSNSPTLSGKVKPGRAQDAKWHRYQNKVRLLAAGAPCQPFSLGGKHLADKDGRNLFPEVFRAMRELRPLAVILENVRGLARESFRPYFEYILRQLECPSIKPRPHELWQNHDKRVRRYQLSVGYEPQYWVTPRLVEAANFGVPQLRQRVFIVATRRDLLPPYVFPPATHSKSALLRILKSGEYWETRGVQKPKELSLPQNGIEEPNGKKPWRTVRDALAGLPVPAESEDQTTMNHWKLQGAKSYPGHSGSTMDWPAKTIKAGVHGVPGGENTIIEDGGTFRYFTLREAARIQTFPDEHLFKGARIHITRQIGNAVPCDLATALATPLYVLLRNASVTQTTKA